MDVKIYKKSGSTFTNYTSVKDYYGTAKTIALLNTDYLYIGSPFKFNSFYVKLSTPSTASSVMALQLWNGTIWENAQEINDSTSGFTQSGSVDFVPDKYKTWQSDDTNRIDSNMPLVYLWYWIRINFTVTLSPSPVVSYLGHLFVNSDTPLTSEYPILASSSLKTAYKAGKTDWEEQRFLATQLTIESLIQKNIIKSGNEILDISRVRLPAISKTAQVIFSGMGDDYIQQTNAAKDEFERRVHSNVFYVDHSNTAIVDHTARIMRQSRMSR